MSGWLTRDWRLISRSARRLAWRLRSRRESFPLKWKGPEAFARSPSCLQSPLWPTLLRRRSSTSTTPRWQRRSRTDRPARIRRKRMRLDVVLHGVGRAGRTTTFRFIRKPLTQVSVLYRHCPAEPVGFSVAGRVTVLFAWQPAWQSVAVQVGLGIGAASLRGYRSFGIKRFTMRKPIRMPSSFVLVCFVAACATNEPTMVMGGCLAPAIDAAQKSGAVTKARCDFGRVRMFAAVPPTPPSHAELTAAGLTQDAIYALEGIRTPGSNWCTIDKKGSAVPGVKPGWIVDCVAAGLGMEKFQILSTQAVDISLGHRLAGPFS